MISFWGDMEKLYFSTWLATIPIHMFTQINKQKSIIRTIDYRNELNFRVEKNEIKFVAWIMFS